jgi:glycerophosphoryl diester phosphodiesterase
MGSTPHRSANRFLALLRSRRPHPVIIAHRGDSFHAPENTLEAARLAWEAGAPAWELDVQLTRDGVPVVLHDESLLRTTDVATRFAGDPRGRDRFRVSDFDYDEICDLDAGSWFVAESGGPRSARDFGTLDRLAPAHIAHYRSGQVVIPRLDEALILTVMQDWLVNVEIKSFPENPHGLVERVLDVIAQTGTADRVLISSFDHHDIVAARRPIGRDGVRYHPDYGLGILLATPLHRLPDYATNMVGADTVHVSTEVLGAESIAYRRGPSAGSLRHDLVAALQERGVPVLVYTVNHQRGGSLARHMGEIGVDGIFTDDPRGLMTAMSPGCASGDAGAFCATPSA